MRFFVLLALLPLAACGSDASPEASGEIDVQSNETAEVPPRIGDVAGPEAAPIRVPGPNDVVNVETGEIGVATVQDAEDTYDVNIARMEILDGIDTSGASPQAVRRWLARFQPLAGAGRYDDLDPAVVQEGYTSLVTFLFSDGSAQTIYVQRQPDGLAVLSQPDGPVWRLAPEALRDLVPRADALRAD